jgi:MFS family permease
VWSNPRRLCAASFLVDLAHYLVFGAIPFQALRLGANPFVLGLIPSLFAVTYVAASMLAGRFSDGASRLALVRNGILFFFVITIAIAFASRIEILLGLIPFTGVVLGLFWPPAQAAISDETPPHELSRALAEFNVAWTSGKGLGFFLAGIITQAVRPEAAVLSGAIPLVAAIFIVPRHAAPPAQAVPASGPTAPAARTARHLVLLAWVANAVAYGVSSTFHVHAPELLVERGENAFDFGAFLGIVFAVQAISFATLARRIPNFRDLVLAHATGILSLGIFLFVPGLGGEILSAIPLGLSLALAYHASLHASLHREHGRGLAAGVHEGVIGIGSSLIPLAGGMIAAQGSLKAPFVLCIFFLVLGLAPTAICARVFAKRSEPHPAKANSA